MDKKGEQNEPLISGGESIKRIETVPKMSDSRPSSRKGSDQRRLNYVEFAASSVSIQFWKVQNSVHFLLDTNLFFDFFYQTFMTSRKSILLYLSTMLLHFCVGSFNFKLQSDHMTK